jgi:hypothetical protein
LRSIDARHTAILSGANREAWCVASDVVEADLRVKIGVIDEVDAVVMGFEEADLGVENKAVLGFHELLDEFRSRRCFGHLGGLSEAGRLIKA